MKKYFSFLLFLLISLGSFAQCPLSVSITSVPDVSTTPVCKGDPVVLTAVQSPAAVTPVYYWIVDGDTILGTDSTFSVFANNQTVSVIMSTSTGCAPDSDSAVSIPITIQTVIIQESVTQSNYDCNLDVGDVQITQNGGTDPVNYDLQGVGTNTTGTFNGVPAGTYILFMTDAAGCMDTGEVVVTPMQNVESSPVLIGPECNETTADISVSTTGDYPPFNYELVGVGTGSSYSDVPQGSYTLYTTDNNGCMDTNEVVIVPFDCPDPVPTEMITPNDDGQNDMWQISNIRYYPDNEVFIFDRWGQRVYHKKEYDNLDGWKAKYVGVDMPVSTYYYILKIRLEQRDDLVFKGAISVFR